MAEDEFNFGEGWGRITVGDRLVVRNYWHKKMLDCIIGGDTLSDVRLSFLDQRLSCIELDFEGTAYAPRHLPELLELAYGK